MNYPQELVDRYAAFYRPKKRGSNAATKPLAIAAKILLQPDNLRMSNEELKIAIAAQTSKLMGQIHRSTAEGYWVSHGEKEREAIEEFARFFVDEFFLKGCRGRRDLLCGNKFALVSHSCEWILEGADYSLKANG